MQPEQGTFELDLAVHDQRLAFHILLSVSIKEARDNLRDYTLLYPDGTGNPMAEQLKRSAEQLKRTAEQLNNPSECAVKNV